MYGANPYLQGPHAIALDPVYPFIGAKWVTIPSAYGPVFTALSYVLAPLSVASSVLAYKARNLPPGTDLAVVVVPAPAVLRVVDDCAAGGVKSLVVISAGFAEAGEAGRTLQRALVERVRNHGLRMVGPNCMGLLNASTAVRLNASFSPIMPPSGHVSLRSLSTV